MYRRSNRLFFIALSAIILAVIAGCSQPNDVLAPVASTKIILRPERLPTPPQGMLYELWVKKNNDQSVSLGKFNWNNQLYRFSDSAGNVNVGQADQEFEKHDQAHRPANRPAAGKVRLEILLF